MMNFALVGDDPVVLSLLRETARREGFAITHAALLGELAAQILEISPSTKLVEGWPDLLAEDLAAVVICGSVEWIGEAARQLASAGKTLVVFPQGNWDTELIYELSLERDDTGVRLIPISTILERPYFGQADSESRKDDDPVLHIRFDRDVHVGKGESLETDHLRDFLLPDAGLLRHLGGEYHQVTAVKSLTSSGEIVQATITLTGEGLPDAIWTIRPVTSESRWRMTITRRSGLDESEGRSADVEKIQKDGSFHQGAAVLALIEKSLADEKMRPDWTDLTRDFEILDAMRRSFKRRRTIDLHFETTSERSLFKTQMTAMGCGVLTATFFAVVALLILGSLLDNRSPEERAAESADTIFFAEEFEPGEAELNSKGLQHWNRIGSVRGDPTVPILVEQTESKKLPGERRGHLIELLEEEGIENVQARVEVRDLDGPWLESVMKIARILVFAPLFLFLGLQALLLITRPARSAREETSFSDR